MPTCPHARCSWEGLTHLKIPPLWVPSGSFPPPSNRFPLSLFLITLFPPALNCQGAPGNTLSSRLTWTVHHPQDPLGKACGDPPRRPGGNETTLLCYLWINNTWLLVPEPQMLLMPPRNSIVQGFPGGWNFLSG